MWISVTTLFSKKEHVLQKPLKVKLQLRQNAEETKLILSEHHIKDWKQISVLLSFFIGPLCSQMGRDSHKWDETRLGSGPQMYDDSLQTHSDKRDKSHTDFNFPVFVSLFYSILSIVKSNNNFLLCAWTRCTASVFVRNPIIKKGYEWKKLREQARFQLMSSSCVTFLSFCLFFLSFGFNKASCRVWLSWETQ